MRESEIRITYVEILTTLSNFIISFDPYLFFLYNIRNIFKYQANIILYKSYLHHNIIEL